MAKKQAQKRVSRPTIWTAVYEGVAVRGEPASRTYRVFTVASGRKEAQRTLTDGLMGLPGVEGSRTEPKSIERLNVLSPRLEATVSDLVKGGHFVVPYHRLRPREVALLVSLLITDRRP